MTRAGGWGEGGEGVGSGTCPSEPPSDQLLPTHDGMHACSANLAHHVRTVRVDAWGAGVQEDH